MKRQKPQHDRDQAADPKAAIIALLIRELHLVPVEITRNTGGGYGAPHAVEVDARVSLV